MALATRSKFTRVPYYLRNMSSVQAKTAGILVIGDELLKGEVVDTNGPHITKELHNLGVKVKKISIIGDEVDEISDEIKTFSKSYSYVITTGGIGPTHDDVTFEAVAKAFSVPLALNPQLRRLCEKFYKTTDVNHPGMKLAMVSALSPQFTPETMTTILGARNSKADFFRRVKLSKCLSEQRLLVPRNP
jgi:molybdenum cofactor synthesis domain-containing protein